MMRKVFVVVLGDLLLAHWAMPRAQVPKGQFFTFLVVMFSKSWPFLKIVVTFSKSWPHQLTRCPHSVQKFSTFSTGRWWNFFSEKVSEIITLFNSPNNCTNVFPPNFQLSFPFPPQKKLSATNSINNYPPTAFKETYILKLFFCQFNLLFVLRICKKLLV